MFQEELKEENAEEKGEKETPPHLTVDSKTTEEGSQIQGLRIVYAYDTSLRKYSLTDAPLYLSADSAKRRETSCY
jgi:hypothetical protein